MGAGAALAIFGKLMESERGRALLGKIPVIGSFIPMLQDVAPDMKQALAPATPEQQVIQALTLLSANMPLTPERAEAYRKAMWDILGGVEKLKQALTP